MVLRAVGLPGYWIGNRRCRSSLPFQQAPEEAFGGFSITARLESHQRVFHKEASLFAQEPDPVFVFSRGSRSDKKTTTNMSPADRAKSHPCK